LASGTIAGQGFSEEESGNTFPREGMEILVYIIAQKLLGRSGNTFPREGMEIFGRFKNRVVWMTCLETLFPERGWKYL
jgi:hypothetical protein